MDVGGGLSRRKQSAEYRTISKLLFLSDRAFATSDGKDSEEYGYEVGRVRAVFDLKRSVLDSRCSSVAAPFYERALAGTLEKLRLRRRGHAGTGSLQIRCGRRGCRQDALAMLE